MCFVYAFVFGAVICILGQILKDLNLKFLNFNLMMFLFIVIGALLGPTGILDKLGALGNGGIAIFPMGLGGAVFGVACAMFSGNPVLWIALMVLLVIIIGFAAATGINKKVD